MIGFIFTSPQLAGIFDLDLWLAHRTLSLYSTQRICHLGRPQRDRPVATALVRTFDEPRLMGRAILGWGITGRPCERTGGKLQLWRPRRIRKGSRPSRRKS